MKLFKMRGFQATTVVDIAARAQVSRGTVFNYYPYKEAILVEHLATELAEVERRVQEAALPPLEAIKRVFKELADYFESNRDVVLPLSYELLNPDPERSKKAFNSLPLVRILRDYLADAAGEVRQDFSSDRLARSLANTFFLTALQWAAYRPDVSLHDELEKALELALEGIKS